MISTASFSYAHGDLACDRESLCVLLIIELLQKSSLDSRSPQSGHPQLSYKSVHNREESKQKKNKKNLKHMYWSTLKHSAWQQHGALYFWLHQMFFATRATQIHIPLASPSGTELSVKKGLLYSQLVQCSVYFSFGLVS